MRFIFVTNILEFQDLGTTWRQDMERVDVILPEVLPKEILKWQADTKKQSFKTLKIFILGLRILIQSSIIAFSLQMFTREAKIFNQCL